MLNAIGSHGVPLLLIDRYTYAATKPFVLAARAVVPHDPIQDGHYFLKASRGSLVLFVVMGQWNVVID